MAVDEISAESQHGVEKAYLVIAKAVARPYMLSLSETDLVDKIEDVFQQIGMDVSCCRAPETINFQMSSREPTSFVVRSKGDVKFKKYAKPDLNVDIAYVPILGGHENYPREIHLNSSLIENYDQLVDLLEQDSFEVERIVGNSYVNDRL